MTTLYLTTASEVKQYVPYINNEVDSTIINATILMVQDTLVKSSLRTEFYNDIIANSGSTKNKYLIDNYIKQLISYGVWQQLAVSMSLQLNSSGLRIKESNHSIAAETADIAFYRKHIQGFIDNVRNEMAQYICDNQNDYPLYYNNSYGEPIIRNNFGIGRVGSDESYTYFDIIKNK